MITFLLPFYWTLVPTPLLVFLGFTCPFMNILNVVLFWRLIKSDILRGPEGRISALTSLRRDWAVVVQGEPYPHIKGDSKSHISVLGFGEQLEVKANGLSTTNGHTTSSTNGMKNGVHSNGVSSHPDIKKRDWLCHLKINHLMGFFLGAKSLLIVI